jgi:HK97 family phage prohead protease
MSSDHGRLQSRVTRTADRIVAHATANNIPVAELARLLLPWYEIRDTAAEADSGQEAGPPTVFIFDEIGGSLGVSAKRFAADLNAIDAPVIHVRINSPGGALFDGRAIMNTLVAHTAKIIVFVDGIAASAASIVTLGGDEVIMMPNSELMIHDAAMPEDGQASDHAKAATFLDRESAAIADLYRQRAGGTVEDWRDLMLAETWMFGPEAVTMGLADRAEELPRRSNGDGELEERMRRQFDMSRYGYRYAGRRAAPAPSRRRTAARASVRTEDREPVALPSLRSRMSTDGQMHQAAQLRRDAAAARPGMMAVARRSAPTGVSASRRLTFSAQKRAKLVQYKGQERYHVTGHASVYEIRYEMWDDFGPYWEIVSRGAGSKSLASEPDVAYLVNHAGITMARTTNGSLKLAEDDIGLWTEAWLNPKRQDVRDLVTAIDDEDITEMSFAFMLPDGGGRWSQDFTEFRIDEYDIDRGDVSDVSYGANPYTDVAARSREVLADLDHLPEGAARVALERLQLRVGIVDLGRQVDAHERPERADRDPEPVLVGAGTRDEDRPGSTIALIEALLLED